MPGDITALILASQVGNQEARGKLYREMGKSLRRIAAVHMRNEKQNHTLSVDGIVDEAFMQLVNLNRMGFNDRAHFTALANEFMKRILINYARWKKRDKRGGNVEKVSLHESVISAMPFSPELSNLRDAMERLEKHHPRQKKVLELHYFDGYKQKEIAELLEIGLRTIEKDLRFARAWLAREWEP